MTSHLSPKVAAGAPAFTSGRTPTSGRFAKALRHYSCLHTFISSFPADLQQSLENASDDQDFPDSPVAKMVLPKQGAQV